MKAMIQLIVKIFNLENLLTEIRFLQVINVFILTIH